MSEAKDFYLQVAYALSGCQLVEQELKLYISGALEYVRKCVGNRLPFKMGGQDYEDASMERLIETFRKLTNNDELVVELRKFKTERNFISHKGIAHSLDPMGDVENISVAEFIPRLQAVQTEADRLCRVIHEEGRSFNARLCFGQFHE